MQPETTPGRTPGADRVAVVLLLSLAFLLAAALGWEALQNVEFERSSDAAYGRAHVRHLVDGGLGSYPALFELYNQDARAWSHPPPYRVAYVLLCWLAAQFSGATFETLTYVAFLSQLASVAACYLLGRRHVGDVRAAAIALAVASSPLLVRLGAQPLSDATATFGATLALWTFVELVDRPSRRSFWVFVAAFTLAVTLKELAAVLAPALLGVGWVLRRAKPAPRWSDLLTALTLPAVSSVAIWMVAAGSVTAPLQAFRNVLSTLDGNPYMVQYCSGPWYQYAIDLFVLSPPVFVLGVVGATALIARAELAESRVSRAIVVGGIALALESAFLSKNIRYFTMLDVTLRVAAVEGAFVLCARLARPRTWACALLVVIALFDAWAVRTTFALVHDPISIELLRARGWSNEP